MMVTALVSCAGSMPGVAVINALKQQDEIPIRVIAVDMNPLSVGFYLSDKYFTVPSSSDESFISTILKICLQEKINIVFPVIDEELLVFAESRRRFEAEGIRVITNKPNVIRIAQDKYQTYQFCQENGILVPATFLPSELSKCKLPDFPLIVKPRQGRGTINVFKIRSQRELDFFIEYVPSPLVQEFIDGQEYTIDVLTDFQGKIISIVPKVRIETKAGMQVKGRTVKDERLIQYSQVITEKFGLQPRCNIQCIIAGEEIYLIEVNPKFPASLPFTVAARVNFPLLLVKMYLGEQIQPMIGHFREGLVMLRYWQEIFV